MVTMLGIIALAKQSSVSQPAGHNLYIILFLSVTRPIAGEEAPGEDVVVITIVPVPPADELDKMFPLLFPTALLLLI